MQAKLKQGDGMYSELEGWKVTESWEQGNSGTKALRQDLSVSTAEDSEVAPVPAAEPARRRGQQPIQGHTDSTRQAFLSFPGPALLRSPHTPHSPRLLHPAVPKELGTTTLTATQTPMLLLLVLVAAW